MKKFYLRLLVAAVFSFANVIAFSQPGVLDQTFGVNGEVIISVPLGTKVHPVDIKIQPDQKILALVRIDTSKSGWTSEGYF